MSKENVIEWLNGQDTIRVTLSQGKYITKVERLAKKYPDQVSIDVRNNDGSIMATLPLKALKFSIVTRNLSEEEREAVRERLKKVRPNKSEVKNE